ncbi:hypothetical protein [Streptomyces abikoensis]|uniref:hypothetical protein n=1 Tax=Streptomyces abikoensis TaxID=97398 RepID=UPI001678AE0C|nr:hypothetical protein [Streptomyces abikoensis]
MTNDLSGNVTGPVIQAGVVHNVTLNYQADPVVAPDPPASEVPAAGALGATVLRTREELARTREAMPAVWEYLLFAGELYVGLKELELKRFDYSLGHRVIGRTLRDEVEANAYLAAAFAEAQRIGSDVDRWMSQEAQDKAFGLPGEPGDRDLITHLARRFLGIYESLIDWSIDLRSVSPPAHMLRLFELAARFMRASIVSFESFVETLVEETDRASATVARQDSEPIRLTVAYVMTIDPDVMKEFDKEQRKVKRRRRGGASWF